MAAKNLTLFLLALLSNTIGFGPASAAVLTWPDHPNGQLYRIDTDRKILERETQPDTWEPIGPVNFKDVTAGELPPMVRAFAFEKSNDVRYLVIDCSGQVYQFDFRNRTLARLDNTFFRGFNCFAARFLRQDTLYSFGGYGFWHSHNIPIYFKADKHEWERLSPDTGGPPAIYRGLNGYIAKTDEFFSALNYQYTDGAAEGKTKIDFDVYRFSLPAKRWQKVGAITRAVREHLPADIEKNLYYFWSGRYFLVSYYVSPSVIFFIIDPVKNEFREWRDTYRRFKEQPSVSDEDLIRYYIHGDNLYYYQQTQSSPDHSLQKHKIAISQLYRESVYIGAFYESDSQIWKNLWLILILSLASMSIVFWLLFRRKRLRQLSNLPEPAINELQNLTPEEYALLEALLSSPDSEGLSSEQLNELLQIGDKTPENQRRIRAEAIKNLNLKLKLSLNIDLAIDRKPTALDRRMRLYVLTAEATERLKPLLVR